MSSKGIQCKGVAQYAQLFVCCLLGLVFGCNCFLSMSMLGTTWCYALLCENRCVLLMWYYANLGSFSGVTLLIHGTVT